jgi:hypothetical protein
MHKHLSMPGIRIWCVPTSFGIVEEDLREAYNYHAVSVALPSNSWAPDLRSSAAVDLSINLSL